MVNDCGAMWMDLFGLGNLFDAFDFWRKGLDFYSDLKVR